MSGMANDEYELIGGPMDGQRIKLQPGQRELRVSLRNFPNLFTTDADLSNTPDMREGLYAIKRHPKHGYALVWQGER